MEIEETWRCASATNFEKILHVGEGTYGYVYKVRDKTSNQIYAIKKIKMENEKEGFPITALREIRLLKTLNHENIIRLVDIVTTRPRKNTDSVNVFLLFEYMEHDLDGLMHLNKQHRLYSLPMLKCFIKQLLQAVQAIHDNNIVHRDLKCSNLLVNNEGILKLGDFGLARTLQQNRAQMYTNNVITLNYRPLELVMGARQYDQSVDMWSVGCIIGEILQGAPMFHSSDEKALVKEVSQLCGSPEPQLFGHLPRYQSMAGDLNCTRKLIEVYQGKDGFDRNAIDLLDGLLQLDPRRRLTAAQALKHPFFTSEPLPCDPSEITKQELERHELDNRKEYLAQRGIFTNPENYRKIVRQREVDNAVSPIKRQKMDEDQLSFVCIRDIVEFWILGIDKTQMLGFLIDLEKWWSQNWNAPFILVDLICTSIFL